MPTIQIRTDDKTKNASAALFDKLGITMSEAINLFLRQSVMRGGIPFTLTVTEGQEPNTGILENEFFIDALKRYKSVNRKEYYDIAKIEPFLRALETVDSKKGMRITLQEKAVKARFNFKSKDYVLDYNFEEPDNVFILARKDDKLFVKDCKLSNILETLGSF
jgi:addiction module RelB/DinJ family antitoxin